MRYEIITANKNEKVNSFREAFTRGQTEKFFSSKVEILDTKTNRSIYFVNNN